MASVTIQEFETIPLADQEILWPAAGADIVTTVTTPATHEIAPGTRFVVLTADLDCRAMVGAHPASASGIPILAAITNTMRVTASSSTWTELHLI